MSHHRLMVQSLRGTYTKLKELPATNDSQCRSLSQTLKNVRPIWGLNKKIRSEVGLGRGMTEPCSLKGHRLKPLSNEKIDWGGHFFFVGVA